MNELKHISEFRKVLENYEPSPAAKAVLKDLKFVILVAPTSAGRNTIIRDLLKTGKYHFIVSDTTRAPRFNDGELEQHGTIYWFRSEQDVLSDLRNGQFLEAEVIHGQQVSGVSIRELQKAGQEHKIAITDLDIGGVDQVVQVKPDTLAILVLPPSFEEWQRRISSRGKMNDIELIRRLKTAQRIFSRALTNHNLIFVINDNLAETVAKVEKIVHEDQINRDEQHRARILAKELLKETEDFLKTATSTLDE